MAGKTLPMLARLVDAALLGYFRKPESLPPHNHQGNLHVCRTSAKTKLQKRAYVKPTITMFKVDLSFASAPNSDLPPKSITGVTDSLTVSLDEIKKHAAKQQANHSRSLGTFIIRC
jgi:hypothetical protein